MILFLTCNKIVTNLSIAPLTITPLKWAWDFNHYVPLMSHILLQLHRKNLPMPSPELIKPLGLLSTFNASAKRFTTSQIKLIRNTNNNMSNIVCPINFRWETKFGYICRKSGSLEPIISFEHSDTGLAPSPRLWETSLLSSLSPHSFACISYSMWTTFGHTFHHC